MWLTFCVCGTVLLSTGRVGSRIILHKNVSINYAFFFRPTPHTPPQRNLFFFIPGLFLDLMA